MGGRGETFVLETGGGLGKRYLFRKLVAVWESGICFVNWRRFGKVVLVS